MGQQSKPNLQNSLQELLNTIGNELKSSYKIKPHWQGFPQLYPEYYLVKKSKILSFIPLRKVVCGVCMYGDDEIHVAIESRVSQEDERLIMKHVRGYTESNNIPKIKQHHIKRSPWTIHCLSELDQMCPQA